MGVNACIDVNNCFICLHFTLCTNFYLIYLTLLVCIIVLWFGNSFISNLCLSKDIEQPIIKKVVMVNFSMDSLKKKLESRRHDASELCLLRPGLFL